jgi:hypothetical protein
MVTPFSEATYVPSRKTNNCAPYISGSTWVYHNRKFSRTSFSDMVTLRAAPLDEEEEEAPDLDIAAMHLKTI